MYGNDAVNIAVFIKGNSLMREVGEKEKNKQTSIKLPRLLHPHGCQLLTIESIISLLPVLLLWPGALVAVAEMAWWEGNHFEGIHFPGI